MFYRWLLWSSVSFFAIIAGLAIGSMIGIPSKKLVEKNNVAEWLGCGMLAILGPIWFGIALGLGVAQGTILGEYYPVQRAWAQSTIVGFTIGSFAAWASSLLFVMVTSNIVLRLQERTALARITHIMMAFIGAVFGTSVGICQWVALRAYTQHAIWWVPTTTLCASIAIGVGALFFAPGTIRSALWKPSAIGAAIYAVLSGLAFALLIG